MKTSDQRWRANVRAEQAAPQSPAAAGATLDVVLADDSELVRAHLVELLGALERVRIVGQAENTPQLIDLVDGLHPHVVVLDISMPGTGGIKALQHIKAAYPETRVIMLTNHSNEFYRKKCLSSGATFFFDKSTEFERVGEVLGRMSA